jgi:hypothetical protein
MKTIFLFGLLLTSSCATISEYNQGCRDGLAWENGKQVRTAREIEAENGICNNLDNIHKLEKKEYK